MFFCRRSGCTLLLYPSVVLDRRGQCTSLVTLLPACVRDARESWWSSGFKSLVSFICGLQILVTVIMVMSLLKTRRCFYLSRCINGYLWGDLWCIPAWGAQTSEASGKGGACTESAHIWLNTLPLRKIHTLLCGLDKRPMTRIAVLSAAFLKEWQLPKKCFSFLFDINCSCAKCYCKSCCVWNKSVLSISSSSR